MDESSEVGALRQLQTQEQIKLLDNIDELRNLGLDYHDIQLPQLIVVGDQSSGKSSLLAALTGLRFPTSAATMCTTFATEVVLRRGAQVEIVCSIRAHKQRSESQKRKLDEFREAFNSLETFNFAAVIEKAKKKMMLDSNNAPKIQLDTLRVCYTGPELPSLTIVDLPGMFERDHHDEQAAGKVIELVDTFMKNPKSIVLAAIQATNDFNNQKVSKRLGLFDPQGERTLGIITKPDRVEPGGGGETQVLKLVKNKTYTLKHGWHAVRNRGDTAENQTNDERDETERQFFSTGAWASIPRRDVGIPALRIKLSHILLEHISRELPSLVKALRASIDMTKDDLKKLGDARETIAAQRSYLIEHAEKFQSLTQDALRGIYSDSFFDLTPPTEPSTARLRNEIQNLNLAFADTMFRKGHAWEIMEIGSHRLFDSKMGLSSPFDEDYQANFESPAQISRQDFLEKHIGTSVRNSRQAGLTSLVNPYVIGEIFRKQSAPWRKIAEHHLHQVFGTVENYIGKALGHLMDADTETCMRLIDKHIDQELGIREEAFESKLVELLVPYAESVPIIYDPTFVYEIEEIRTARYIAKAEQNHSSGVFGGRADVNASPGHRAGQQQLLTEIDDFTNGEILDLMQAYYKRVITVFISNVTALAIENCMIKDLNSIFSPTLISTLSDEKISDIASESERTKTQRIELRKKLETLENGRAVLHEHMAFQPSARMTQLHTSRDTRKKPRSLGSAITLEKEVLEVAISSGSLPLTPPSSRSGSSQPDRPRADSLTASPSPAKPGRKRSPLPTAQRKMLFHMGQDLDPDDEF